MNLGNFNESIKGFFWGLGFVIASLGGISVYALTVAAKVESGYRTMLSNKVLESTTEFDDNYKLTLSDIFKDDEKVRITAELQNITNESIYMRAIVASTFDKDNKFIGNCVGQGNEIYLAPNAISYIDINCNLIRPQAERVHSAKLKVKWI